jgi:hypothetical protein
MGLGRASALQLLAEQSEEQQRDPVFGRLELHTEHSVPLLLL